MNYKTSWMKKRVKVDVQMVREYLNVIILSLGILILQLYHLLHVKKIVLNSVKVSNWKRFTIWSKLDTPETD